MNQQLLHRASGGTSYDGTMPRVPHEVWVEMSQDRHTQAEMHYVDLAEMVIAAREWAKFADGASEFVRPQWVSVGATASILLLVASLVVAFFNGHVASGLAALAFAGIWFFGTAAERTDHK